MLLIHQFFCNRLLQFLYIPRGVSLVSAVKKQLGNGEMFCTDLFPNLLHPFPSLQTDEGLLKMAEEIWLLIRPFLPAEFLSIPAYSLLLFFADSVRRGTILVPFDTQWRREFCHHFYIGLLE